MSPKGSVGLNHLWRALRRYFLTGLIVVLPVAITAYVLWIAFNFFDHLLGNWVEEFWGLHVPGLGAIALVVVITLVGLIATNVVGSQLISLGERILAHIPVVRTVYGSVKQVIAAFAVSNREVFEKVVLAEYPRRGAWVIGFITARVEAGPGDEPMVTVFIPNTPNPTSGYLVVLPEKDCRPLDISVQDAFKSVVSMGVIVPEPLRGEPTPGALSRRPKS